MNYARIFQFGKRNYFVKISSWKKLELRCEGFSSRVLPTTLHVTQLDYDNIVSERTGEQRLVEDLRYLQQEFTLGNFYIFETSYRGRHALCVDARPLGEVMDTLKTSNCDASFKKSPRINEYRCSILRKGKKGDRPAPKFLYVIKSPHEGKNLQSLAHANYIYDSFGIKIDLKNPIGNAELEIQEYNTSKKIEPFCPACERGLRLDFKFCPYCGENQREGQ